MSRYKSIHRVKTRILRVFFYLLYHPFAGFYDIVASIASLGMWNQWVKSVIPELTGTQILELGHGPGHLLSALQAGGKFAFGVDESCQMGKLARENLHKGGLQPLIVRSHSQNLPFPKHSFSHIVSTFPSEYITNHRTILEAFRVLDPDGTLVIIPSARITGNQWFHKAATWLFKVTDQAVPWDDRYQAPFKQAGFHVRQKTVHNPSWSLLIIIAEKLTPNSYEK